MLTFGSLLLYMGSMVVFMFLIPIMLNSFGALPAMHLQPILTYTAITEG